MTQREIISLITFILLMLVSPVFSLGTIRKIRRIRRTTAYSIPMLPSEGLCKVRGRTKGKPIQSPLTNRSYLLSKVIIETASSTGKGSHWTKVYENLSASPFTIYDDSGEIPVVVSNVDLDIDIDKYPDGLFGTIPLEIREAAQRLGVKTKGFLGFDKRLRITEHFLNPGDQVYVIGEIDYLDGRKVITSKVNQPLLISNRTEKELLPSLYWRLALNTVLSFLIAIVVSVIFLAGN